MGVTGPQRLQPSAWAVVSVSLVPAWYEFGFSFLFLPAALTQRGRQVLEAAALDGASGLRMARSETAPRCEVSGIVPGQ